MLGQVSRPGSPAGGVSTVPHELVQVVVVHRRVPLIMYTAVCEAVFTIPVSVLDSLVTTSPSSTRSAISLS